MAGKRTIVAAVVPPAAPKPVRKRKHVSASHQATIAAEAIPAKPGAQAKPAPPPSARPTVLPADTGPRAPRKQHLATIAAQVVPPAQRPSARTTDVPGAARPPSGLATMIGTDKPSSMNTMVATNAPAGQGVKKQAFGLQATMIATDARDEVADEIQIDLSDSVIAKVPPGITKETSVRIKVRAPTFDNLAVIAPRRWPWWYAAGAAAAAVIIVLLIVIP